MNADMEMLFFSERLKTASFQDLQKAFAEAASKLLGEVDPVTCNISSIDFKPMNSITMTVTLTSSPNWLGMDGANTESSAAGV